MIIHEPFHPGEIVKDALIDGAGLSVTEALLSALSKLSRSCL